MSTQGVLKARIADDIVRDDLTEQIGDAITDAIKYYQEERFLFSDERVTFTCIADQTDYTESDDADIGRLVQIYGAFVNDGTNTTPLARYAPNHMEHLQDNSGSSGEPYAYSYFSEKIRLYPIPDSADTIIMNAQTVPAAPSSDAVTDNAWMNEGFELIRCYAKRLLAIHTLRDSDLKQAMDAAVGDAEFVLRRRMNKLNATGRIEVDEF